MVKVWIVEGEHFTVPGRAMTVHSTEAGAIIEAVSLTNIMLNDTGLPAASAKTWKRCVRNLQRFHGAGHCYVEISERDIRT